MVLRVLTSGPWLTNRFMHFVLVRDMLCFCIPGRQSFSCVVSRRSMTSLCAVAAIYDVSNRITWLWYSTCPLVYSLLDTVYFVHCANRLHEFLDKSKKSCGKYFERLLTYIEVPAAKIPRACRTVRNAIFKAFSLYNSDRAKQIVCLRRKEKLAG